MTFTDGGKPVEIDDRKVTASSKMSNPNMVKEVGEIIKTGVRVSVEMDAKGRKCFIFGGIDQAAKEIDLLYSAERKAEIEKSVLFVQHIENHLTELGLKGVICKICGKTIDEIYDAEIRKRLNAE